MTYTAHSISTSVFATRTLIASGLSKDAAIDLAARETRQPHARIADVLACGPTGNHENAHRIPANSMYDGAGCVDLTNEEN